MSEQDERPVVPNRTTDEEDAGWGDAPSDEDADDTRRFLEERPPHHGD